MGWIIERNSNTGIPEWKMGDLTFIDSNILN